MPKNNSAQAKDLADQYLKLLADQKSLQSQIDSMKQTLAKFCEDNQVNELTSGNIRLKVS